MKAGGIQRNCYSPLRFVGFNTPQEPLGVPRALVAEVVLGHRKEAQLGRWLAHPAGSAWRGGLICEVA